MISKLLKEIQIMMSKLFLFLIFLTDSIIDLFSSKFILISFPFMLNTFSFGSSKKNNFNLYENQIINGKNSLMKEIFR